MPELPADVTQALLDARAGGASGAEAADRVWAAVYGELHHIADRELRGGRGSETLTPTALVHEAYVKLVDAARVDLASRTHFFALSCRAMRQVIVDHARRRQAGKRGGGARPLPLDAVATLADAPAEDVLALDAALERLAALDPRLEQVVECRYFGGLSVPETAEVMGTSERTVERDWARAKAYLYRALAQG